MRAGIGVGRPPGGQGLTHGAFQELYLAGLRCLLEWTSQVEVTEMLKSSGEKSRLYTGRIWESGANGFHKIQSLSSLSHSTTCLP